MKLVCCGLNNLLIHGFIGRQRDGNEWCILGSVSATPLGRSDGLLIGVDP